MAPLLERKWKTTHFNCVAFILKGRLLLFTYGRACVRTWKREHLKLLAEMHLEVV